MNGEEISSQKNYEQEICSSCLQNSYYLIFHKKTVSRTIALLLIVGFFIFLMGFFWGKKQGAEDFGYKIEHENFSDQISFAISSLYDKDVKYNAHDATTANNEVAVETIQIAENNNKETKKTYYVAHLFGGKKKDVIDFAQRLNKKGMKVDVKERISTSAREENYLVSGYYSAI